MLQERTKRNRIRRICEGTFAIFCGTLFLLFGGLIIKNGGSIFGLGFVGIGMLAIATACVYVWRGSNLGAEIVGDNLVIRDYFSQRAIPLSRIARFYRSVDATVLVTVDGHVTVDDCYFNDLKIRDALLDSLKDRIPSVTAVGAK